MMRLRDDCRAGRQAVRRSGRPDILERMVIIAEDSRFNTHHGIDFIELRRREGAPTRE